MRVCRYSHNLQLFLALALFCTAAVGTLRNDLLRILGSFQYSEAVSYGVSKSDQSLESFFNELEAALFSSPSSQKQLDFWVRHYQTSEFQQASFASISQTKEQASAHQVQLLKGEAPFSERTILKLFWYAAALKRPVIVLDLIAKEGKVNFNSFYITSDSHFQSEFFDSWLDQNTRFVNGSILLIRTESVWSYVVRHSPHEDIYQFINYMKNYFPFDYPDLKSLSPLNIHPDITGCRGLIWFKDKIRFQWEVNPETEIDYAFLQSLRGKELVEALYYKFRTEYVNSSLAQQVGSTSLNEGVRTESSSKPVASKDSYLSGYVTGYMPRPEQGEHWNEEALLLTPSAHGKKKEAPKEPSFPSEYEPPKAELSKYQQADHSTKQPKESRSAQASYSSPQAQEDNRTELQSLLRKVAEMKETVSKDYKKFQEAMKSTQISEEKQVLKCLKVKSPELFSLVGDIRETLNNLYEEFNQMALMGQVRRMYVLYYKYLLNDKDLLSAAGFLSTMEGWFKKLASHPLILLHRTNNILWTDIIRTLAGLEEARREYSPAKNPEAHSEEMTVNPVVGAERFIADLTALLTDEILHTQGALFLEKLEPFRMAIHVALLTLREQVRYIPPVYYPQAFQQLCELLNEHREKIVSVEQLYHPTWHLARRFVSAMIENGLEGHMATNDIYPNVRALYEKDVRKSKETFSKLFVGEQIRIAEEFTDPGFFSETVRRLVATGAMKSLSGYKLAPSGAITGSQKPLALQNSKAAHPGRQWQLALPGQSELVVRRHFTPDMSPVTFSARGSEKKKIISLQLHNKQWDISPSQLMYSCINLHENTPVQFIQSSPGCRELSKKSTESHLKDQLKLDSALEGYLRHTTSGIRGVLKYLATPKRAIVSGLPKSVICEALPWEEQPWNQSISIDQRAALSSVIPAKSIEYSK